MQPGDFTPAARGPALFGQGNRELVGVPKVIVIANPAPGADWIYAHSGPSWVYVRCGFSTLTTSAAAGTRFPGVMVKYAGTIISQFGALGTQIASLTNNWNISPVSPVAGFNLASPIGIPDNFILKDGMTFQILTAGILAGDQWSTIALYVEEFTDKCLELL